MFRFLFIICVVWFLPASVASSKAESDEKNNGVANNIADLVTEKFKLDLWSRGAYSLESVEDVVSIGTMQRVGPVSYERRQVLKNRDDPNCEMSGYCFASDRFRGGSQDTLSYGERLDKKIQELGQKFGQEFLDSIERNKKEHKEDCEASCEMYYCANPQIPLVPLEDLLNQTTIRSYSMGPVPPEDFAESFGYAGNCDRYCFTIKFL